MPLVFVLSGVFLNRARGMNHWLRPLFALYAGGFMFFFSHDYYCSLVSYGLCWGGVSMGWGDYDIVATDRSVKQPSPYEEGDYNFVQTIVFLLTIPKEYKAIWHNQLAAWNISNYVRTELTAPNWLNHCRLALVVMGFYRAMFFFIAAIWLGKAAIIAGLYLTPMFWLSSELGFYTTKLFNFKYMEGGWEHQEVIYGINLGVATSILYYLLNS